MDDSAEKPEAPKPAAKSAAAPSKPTAAPSKAAATPAGGQARPAAAQARSAARPVAKPVVAKPAAAPKKERSPLTVSRFSPAGKAAGELKLPASIFAQKPNQAVMHQAYLRQLANARQGTASTKTRGLVSGGGAKPYRQKGTGRARHGSDREPSMVGGGTVFGPQPRSYAQRMPRKMRRLALRSALSVKANEGLVSVIDGFDLEAPKTRAVVDLLRAIGVENTALVVLPAPNDVVSRSFNNLPWAKVVLARNLSLYDIFTHDLLVIARGALELLEENFAADAAPNAGNR